MKNHLKKQRFPIKYTLKKVRFPIKLSLKKLRFSDWRFLFCSGLSNKCLKNQLIRPPSTLTLLREQEDGHT